MGVACGTLKPTGLVFIFILQLFSIFRINPVVGCYEPPHLNPMEGMTEEQKEYEAVKLANMMDKMQREGIIQPCRIGDDGRPQPVEHILELQEELPKQQIKHTKK